ncbi:MAG: DUF309 domain-containing protein [Elusimicrobia bacterium]|nr:DUF309 domain-containing protein [Elusimicrobiota bacterium]
MTEELVPLGLRDELFAVFRACLGGAQAEARFLKEAEALGSRAKGSWVKGAYLDDRKPRYLEALRQAAALPGELEGLARDVEVARILFNAGLFFDCHEYLEPPWREAGGRVKRVLQGIIQAGAGMHKLEQGSFVGCARLLKEAAAKLAEAQGAGLRAFGLAVAEAAGRAAHEELTPERAPRFQEGALEL